ncbi:ABC transporter ATP-binding protein [Leifsonia poae]|uniref:ABC transporter ATP-binding protein n=1 Tax=Leifsonia poae TaxID=110933 RepID=UPI001CBB8807|nr:ABC transporter ATP-binding protein [Leifsonia poae]
MTAALQVSHLTIARESDGALIVDDLSFTLQPGEVMGVVGESGSGKSTVSLGLLGYARPGARITAGSVAVDGVELLTLTGTALRDARRRLVAYVAQDPATALNPSLSLVTQLTESLDGPREENLARVREVLQTVGLPSDDAFLRRKPRQLSGGQQQRIAIAMAVVARPRVIVLDEPTTGLDVSTQAKVLALVKRLCVDFSIAAIYVSHDLAVVGDVADTVTVMYGGQVVELASAADALTRPLHPYSRALLDAVPTARERQVLRPIRGRAPGVGESADGCVFRERCDFATAACASRPALREVRSGGLVRCIRAEEIERLPHRRRIVDRPDRPAVVCRPATLEAEGIDAYYGDRQVLFGVSVDVEPGRCLAIVGESGSGKTTLSRCLIGLHEQYTGALRFDGQPLPLTARERSHAARKQLQYVFQNPFGSLNPRRTVGSSLSAALGLFEDLGARGTAGRVSEALERVEIPSRLAGMYPAELSGGQRQRVAIARALACRPSLLICDEVTSALDVSVQASVIELLRSLLDDGLAMIFVTHDLSVVRSIADNVAVLSEGFVVERGETAAVLDEPHHPYTQALLADTLELPEAFVG